MYCSTHLLVHLLSMGYRHIWYSECPSTVPYLVYLVVWQPRHTADMSTNRRQSFLCYRTTCMEQAADRPETAVIEKGNERKNILYGTILVWHTHRTLRHGSHSFTCKLHRACLSFVSVHQMAPPVTEVADIQLQLTTHLSIPKG